MKNIKVLLTVLVLMFSAIFAMSGDGGQQSLTPQNEAEKVTVQDAQLEVQTGTKHANQVELNILGKADTQEKNEEHNSISKLQTNIFSKSDILKIFNFNEECIHQVIPDSILSNVTTSVLLDSLTKMKREFGWHWAYLSDNLINFSKVPFFYNITYELVLRHDFCEIFLKKYEKISINNNTSGIMITPLNILLCHSFVWHKFNDYQKLNLIKLILECKQDGFSNKSFDFLIVRILIFENIIHVSEEKNSILSAMDIFDMGGINKLKTMLKDYIVSKEGEHGK